MNTLIVVGLIMIAIAIVVVFGNMIRILVTDSLERKSFAIHGIFAMVGALGTLAVVAGVLQEVL